MREVHLPAGVTEEELALAEQIARVLGSKTLYVCWCRRDRPVKTS